MLEKPDLPDENIVACLQDAYGLRAVQIAFLPLGADRHTAVYRAVTDDGTVYLVKLRGGVFDAVFDAMSVAVPSFLGDQGIAQVIAPLATATGQLWAELDAFKVILYPFVEGHNGYEADLSDRHWVEFGAALKAIHTAQVPPALARRLRRETYSPQWREAVEMFLARAETDAFEDSVAAQVVALLQAKRDEIRDLVARADQLARALQARSLEFVLCHSDVHAGNVLIGADGAFYIIDWDDAMLAPRERDLMYAGGGQFGARRTPREEETLFYQGYGRTSADPVALAYYRYERIVQDIAAFCEQLLLTSEGGQDREQSLRYLRSNFAPNNVIEIAYRSDKTLRE